MRVDSCRCLIWKLHPTYRYWRKPTRKCCRASLRPSCQVIRFTLTTAPSSTSLLFPTDLHTNHCHSFTMVRTLPWKKTGEDAPNTTTTTTTTTAPARRTTSPEPASASARPSPNPGPVPSSSRPRQSPATSKVPAASTRIDRDRDRAPSSSPPPQQQQPVPER